MKVTPIALCRSFTNWWWWKVLLEVFKFLLDRFLNFLSLRLLCAQVAAMQGQGEEESKAGTSKDARHLQVFNMLR
jgi:hypothetical protein